MELNIGGKVYEPISAGSYTIAYDLYVQTVLAESGITDAITAHAELKEKNVDPDALGQLILRRLMESGKVADLLAAFVMPKGGAWSPAWAVQTSKEFDTLESQEERRMLLAILAKGLSDFFRPAQPSSKTSR